MVFGSKKVDDVEKSKIISRGSAEGTGVFSCTAGSHAGEPFTTTDKDEWQKHLQSSKHYQQGTAPCAICENPVNMNEVPTRGGNKPIHPDCQQPVEEL